METKEESIEPNGLLLEAPEFLDPDQNLFDQPPFSTAINALQSRLGFNSIASQSIVSALSWDHERDELTGKGVYDRETPTHGFETKSKGEQQSILGLLARRLHYHSPTELTFPQADNAVKVVVSELFRFPYWGHYIGIKISGHEYKKTGEPIHVRGTRIPVESYAKWVNDKLRREELAKMKGIEEIFPDEVQTTGSRTTKKWKILKASEIVRDKRT